MADNENLEKLIKGMTKHFGRVPTEQEVHQFIFGDAKTREAMWERAKRENVKPEELETNMMARVSEIRNRLDSGD